MKTIKQTYPGRGSCLLAALMCLILILIEGNSQWLRAQALITPRIRSSESAYRDKVRQIYTSQIGIREKQPNSGPAVEEYLRYVGLAKGNPWCAAFVCWVLGKAGVENPGTGWSPGLFPVNKVIWERKKEWTIDSGQWTMRKELKVESGKLRVESGKVIQRPGAGDVFGLYFQEKKRIAHVGFVDQWDEAWLVTVEGNTNDSGSREGDGVYRKRRLVRSIYKVARYIN